MMTRPRCKSRIMHALDTPFKQMRCCGREAGWESRPKRTKLPCYPHDYGVRKRRLAG
jgi:hypothetical protein